MMKKEEIAIDNLIGYLDNNSCVSPEDINVAINSVYKSDNRTFSPQEKKLIYQIVGLLNKRTAEVENFIEILESKTLSKEEKNKFYLEHFPFQDANLDVEKIIFQDIYNTKEYQDVESLILDLVYDDIDEPEKMKERIREIIEDNNISFNEKNKERTRQKK